MKSLILSIQNQIIQETLSNIDNKIICEALNCTCLKEVAKQIYDIRGQEKQQFKREDDEYETKYGKKNPWKHNFKNDTFKQIFANYWSGPNIELDKISDSDVTKYSADDWNDKKKSPEKTIREIIKNNKNAIILSQNPDTNKYEFYIVNSKIPIYLDVMLKEKTYWAKYYSNTGERAGEDKASGGKKMTQAKKIEILRNKNIYIIDITGKFQSWKQKRELRDKQKKDMILLDKYSLENIAEKNRKRYKEIVAKMKINKENSDNILDECNDVINKMTKIATDIAKDPVTYADIIVAVSQIMLRIYDKEHWVSGSGRTSSGYYSGYKGLLPNIMSYIEVKNKTINKKGEYYDLYLSQLKVAKQNITNALNDIKNIAAQANIKI